MKTQLFALCCAALLSAPAFAADAAAPAQAEAQARQPIPLSLARVAKNLGAPGVYVYDCNPEEIYSESHIKGSIKTNVANWQQLLPKDKANSFLIFYCINRMCNVSWEAATYAINQGYQNVYVMPDGIQGWVSNGYEFEGTGRKDAGLEAARKAREGK